MYSYLRAFVSFPHRNRQCGLQPAVWPVRHRSVPAPLLVPPPFPFLPVPVGLIGLVPDPLDPFSSPLTCHNAHQRVPHPHAHECGGVPHRPALHDSGEAKISHLAQPILSVRDPVTFRKYDCCVADLTPIHKQRKLVCWSISHCKFWEGAALTLTFLHTGVAIVRRKFRGFCVSWSLICFTRHFAEGRGIPEPCTPTYFFLWHVWGGFSYCSSMEHI